MSDAMKNGEIEDVLSSIRRLVSQESPGAPAGKMAQSAMTDATVPPVRPQDADEAAGGPVMGEGTRAGPGRLVLTPALRVVPGSPPAASKNTPTQDAERVAGPLRLTDAESRASLERTIAELEEAVAQYDEEWEPDGTEPPQQVADVADGTVRGSDDAYESGQQDAPADNVRPFVIPMTTRVGRSEAPLGAANLPTGSHVSHGYAAGQPDAAAGLSGGMMPPAVSHDPLDDEDLLHELVARLVREELQGQLGERITRNVRKLVRSEIARALASRDLT